MEVVFSVKDNTLEILENKHIYLFNGKMVASTERNRYGCYELPSSLIRKPKTDEELAEEKYPEEIEEFFGFQIDITNPVRNAFLEGRKSFGNKEFHLTREELEDIINKSRIGGIDSQMVFWEGFKVTWKYQSDEIISSLTTPIFPHTITVQKDGDKYIWETIKASY